MHNPCRFELLASTASDLLQAGKPQEAVESICRRVMAHLDCHLFFNFLADEKAGRLRLNAFAGIPEEEARRIEWLDYGVAACGCAARDGCRVVVEHIPSSLDERTELVKPYGIKACAAHPLKGPGGKIIGTLLFGTRSRESFTEEDLSLMNAVTDQVAMAMARMKDEEALRESEKRFRTSIETMLSGFAILSSIRNETGRIVDFRYEYINETGCRLNGRSHEETVGRTFIDLFPELKEKEAWLFDKYARTAETGEPFIKNSLAYEGGFAGKDASKIFFDVKTVKMGDGIAVSWEDVTEHRENAEALRRKAEELETLLESVPALVWIAHDPDASHITGNRVASEFLRVPRGKEVSLTASPDKRPTNHKAVLDGRELSGDELPMQRAARGESVSGFEFDLVFDEGTVCRLVANATPLFDSHGRPRGAIGAYVDITESKRMEEELKTSLSAKENLLRELSHRTKNNMQVISSLLNLQAGRSIDSRVINALIEAQDRIQAMALVHEKLYKGGSVNALNIKEYARDLANNLLKSHQGKKGPVRLELELEEVCLPHDMVLPSGLIINELISNSLKHAFPNGKPGVIFISLRMSGEKVELRYRDDGPGLPEGFNLSRIETLGLKLVRNLAAHQLRGTIELMHHSGTEFVFRFPLQTMISDSIAPLSH